MARRTWAPNVRPQPGLAWPPADQQRSGCERTEAMSTPRFPRRRLLAGMGGLGVAMLAAACGEGWPGKCTQRRGGGRRGPRRRHRRNPGLQQQLPPRHRHRHRDRGDLPHRRPRRLHDLGLERRQQLLRRPPPLARHPRRRRRHRRPHHPRRRHPHHHQPHPPRPRGRGRLPRQGPPGRHPPR